jgi:hypothetical protein
MLPAFASHPAGKIGQKIANVAYASHFMRGFALGLRRAKNSDSLVTWAGMRRGRVWPAPAERWGRMKNYRRPATLWIGSTVLTAYCLFRLSA